MDSAPLTSFRFTLRTLLLSTIVLAAVFASWRLASSNGVLFFVIVCEAGATAGMTLATLRRRNRFVLRGSCGGAIGGGTGLVASLFWFMGWGIFLFY